jgi:hypothetical protein
MSSENRMDTKSEAHSDQDMLEEFRALRARGLRLVSHPTMQGFIWIPKKRAKEIRFVDVACFRQLEKVNYAAVLSNVCAFAGVIISALAIVIRYMWVDGFLVGLGVLAVGFVPTIIVAFLSTHLVSLFQGITYKIYLSRCPAITTPEHIVSLIYKSEHVEQETKRLNEESERKESNAETKREAKVKLIGLVVLIGCVVLGLKNQEPLSRLAEAIVSLFAHAH